jgi:hypothetical protein
MDKLIWSVRSSRFAVAWYRAKIRRVDEAGLEQPLSLLPAELDMDDGKPSCTLPLAAPISKVKTGD